MKTPAANWILMNKFTRQLLTEWRKLGLPFEGDTFVIAVSGGADSCALWLAIDDLIKRKKLRNRFVAAHFNHNLRGNESEEDEKFVKEIAVKLGFELVSKTSEAISEKNNLEQNARFARYKFFEETAKNLKAKAILTAHTLNDQAETFLQNLIRGSGIEGLGAMREVRPLNKNKETGILVVRPLLNWAKRKDTENVCHQNEIEFRLDSMNKDLTFSRVRIRKILIPMLEDFNPKIVGKLSKTAKLLREDFDELETASVEKMRLFHSNTEKTELNLDDLKNVFPSMRRRILRLWLKENRGDLRRLSSKNIQAIENLAFSRKSGKIVEIANGEQITKNNGKLIFKRSKNE